RAGLPPPAAIRRSEISISMAKSTAQFIEVAFHDSTDDAKLLRSAIARAAVAKAAYHAAIKYMNQFDGLAINYLPEPPYNLRAVAGTNGNIALTWNKPIASGNSGAPTNYVVYLSTNGYGFGNPLLVPGVNTTNLL